MGWEPEKFSHDSFFLTARKKRVHGVSSSNRALQGVHRHDQDKSSSAGSSPLCAEAGVGEFSEPGALQSLIVLRPVHLNFSQSHICSPLKDLLQLSMN